MTTRTVKGPFKVDHVGSLLRPERVKQAREEYQAGSITHEELTQIEDEEIRRVIQKQKEVGLQAVTDGEFRRGWWHLDFMWGLNGFEQYEKDHGYQFAGGIESKPLDVRTTGKISWNTSHPFLEHFRFLKEEVGDDAVAKFTIPSLNQFLHEGIRQEEHYATVEEFAKDIQKAYIDAVQHFYDLGCRYLQLDDVFWGFLAADGIRGEVVPKEEWETLKRIAKENIQVILDNKPEDLTLTTHVCRGNYKSSYAAAGPYYPVAKELFDDISYDGYFLEYDDDRSGDFGPLEHFSGEGTVVLGLVTSKFANLEDLETLKKRIDEASQYIPKEQLSISPQCGFASTEEGNLLTEEEQWEKLTHLVKNKDYLFGE